MAPITKIKHLKRPHTLSESVGASKKRIPDAAAALQINHTNMRIQQLYHTHSNPPATAGTGIAQSRKGQSKRSQQKAATNKPARQPKQKNSANNKQSSAKAAKTPSYASSAKSANRVSNSIAALDSALLAEPYPEKSLKWTHQPNEIAPKGSNTINAMPIPSHSRPEQSQQPVQIVYTTTSQALESEHYLNAIMVDNASKNSNLITEFTPVTWVTKPVSNVRPAARPMKMIMPISTPTTISNTSSIATTGAPPPPSAPSQPIAASRKRVTTSKVNSSVPNKTIKPTRQKIMSSSTISANHTMVSVAPTRAADTLLPPVDMQIQSITNLIQTPISQTASFQPMPHKIQPIASIRAQAPQSLKTTASGVKPKIQITSQQIISPPIKIQPQQTQQPSMQMKPFQNKVNVKLIQSSDGRVILKGPVENIAAVNNVHTPTSGGIVKNISTISGNTKLALQKVTLLPSIKQNAGKNMVVMHKYTNPSNLLKDNKIVPFQPFSSKFNLINPINPSKKFPAPNTVVVLNVGESSSKGDAAGGAESVQSEIITEDTPVDIITSGEDIMMNVPTSTAQPVPLELANTTQIMRHLKSVTTVQSIPIVQTNSINMNPKPLMVRTTEHSQPLKTSASTNLKPGPSKKLKLDNNQLAMKNRSPAFVTATNTDWEDELDQQAATQPIPISNAGQSSNIVDEYVEEEVVEDATMHLVDGQLDGQSQEARDSFICDTEDDIIQFDDGDGDEYNDATCEVVESAAMTPRKLQTPIGQTVNTETSIEQEKPNGNDSVNVSSNISANRRMMLQMQEYDQSGSSQMRNVSVDELVVSGHIG